MKRYKAIAEYYDAEYAGLAMLDRDVPFFLGHLPKRRQRVLELAAGTGRAAIPIAQAGHRVVAVDYDGEMLGIAERKREFCGLREGELALVRADALKLKLREKFDVACIFFNTFLNFVSVEEQDRLLETVRRHLRPRGRVWIDIFNPDLDILSKKHQEHIDASQFYVPALDRSVFRDTEMHQDWGNQVQQIVFHYRWFDEEATERHEEVRFQLTWMMPRELRLVLERNGFAVERMWGDYDGSEVGGESPRIIALARME